MMSKRQVIVESITQCHIKCDHVMTHVKIQDENLATVNLTSKNNPGGEAWEWAQGHWPEFVPFEKTFELPSNGVMVPITGEVFWVCVTGILDPKTRKSLPIEELRAGDASHRRYGARVKGQKIKPVQEQGTRPARTQKTKVKNSPSKKENSLVKHRDKPVMGGGDELDELGELDMQAMVDEKMQEFLEDN